MRVMNLEQGSDDWLIWRQGGLGATCAPILLGLCPEKWEQSRYRLWEELTGRRAREQANIAMLWGRDLEPLCRQFYEAQTGITMHPACVVHDKYDWLRASLDGLNRRERLLLEIKVCNREVHQLALDGAVIDYYHAQIQWQLLVTGLSQAHYFTCNNKSFKGEDQWGGPLTVVRDAKFISDLYAIGKRFWDCVQSDTMPEDTGWFGWLRCGRERKWRRVAEAGTETECGRILDGYINGQEEKNVAVYVGQVGVNPNMKVAN